MGTVLAKTEPLSHGLTVYWFQKNLMVWILDKRFGSVLKLGFIGLQVWFKGL